MISFISRQHKKVKRHLKDILKDNKNDFIFETSFKDMYCLSISFFMIFMYWESLFFGCIKSWDVPNCFHITENIYIYIFLGERDIKDNF